MDYVLKPYKISEYFTLYETLKWVSDGLLPSNGNIDIFSRMHDFEEINYDVFARPRTFDINPECPFYKRGATSSEFDELYAAFNAENEIIKKLINGKISGYGNRSYQERIRKKDWITQKYKPGGETVYRPDDSQEPHNFERVDYFLTININLKAPAIPPEKWLEGTVDWHGCSLDCGDDIYTQIFLHKNDIQREFPVRASQINLSAQLYKGFFISTEDVSDETVPAETRGRPKATDWESFMCELARLQATKELPEKQDATVSIMEKWCIEKYGTSPKKSSLQEKISKFYKAIS